MSAGVTALAGTIQEHAEVERIVPGAAVPLGFVVDRIGQHISAGDERMNSRIAAFQAGIHDWARAGVAGLGQASATLREWAEDPVWRVASSGVGTRSSAL